jgi:hypothetical protein
MSYKKQGAIYLFLVVEFQKAVVTGNRKNRWSQTKAVESTQ